LQGRDKVQQSVSDFELFGDIKATEEYMPGGFAAVLLMANLPRMESGCPFRRVINAASSGFGIERRIFPKTVFRLR